MADEQVYLTAMQVRRRYGGRSDMWLFRALQEDPTFPRPIKLRGQRYWRLAELVAWEQAAAEAAA